MDKLEKLELDKLDISKLTLMTNTVKNIEMYLIILYNNK